MYGFRMSSEDVERYKNKYPAGSRIVVTGMDWTDPHPIQTGTKGTVVCVDDIGTVHCNFDNGRCLGLIPGIDSFRRIDGEST